MIYIYIYIYIKEIIWITLLVSLLRVPSNSKYLSYYFIVIVNWVIVLPNNNISSVNNMKKDTIIKSLLESNHKCISEAKVDSLCLFFLKEKLSSCKKQWISTHLLYSSSSLLFVQVTLSMIPSFLFILFFFNNIISP